MAELAGLGPRTPGSAGHDAAQNRLLNLMGDAGLESVGREPVSGGEVWVHLSGTLPGNAESEILLSAHYDTLAGSPGVCDNATGTAVAVAAASDLARTPRRSGVRLLLTDGEESLAEGSRERLEKQSAAARRKVLASLDLDMLGCAGDGSGIVHLLMGDGQSGRALTPAWLIHAILRAAEVVDFDLVVLDRRWSWWAQLAVRCARPGRISDGRRYLEAGIPAVTLSDLSMTAIRDPGSHGEDNAAAVDGSRLQAWSRVVAATVRRLDGLTDRPRQETEYLVIGGRVWIRRDLVWLGFVLWMMLVWRGLPGSWRQRPASERRALGRAYLPGFAFRMLFLLAVFLIPTFSAVLLFPVALLALLGRAPTSALRRGYCLLAALPSLAFTLWLSAGSMSGWFTVDQAAVMPAILVGLILATYCVWQLES